MVAPTDPYALPHFNMVHAHQIFKRGYDNILSLLSNPPKNDLTNFLGYCEAWAVSIEGHHNSEEEIVFPFLNQKMDYSEEIEQHKVIHSGLTDLLTMIHEAQADNTKFDAAKMSALMVNLKEPLFTHLDEEVEHIHASKLKEAGFEAGAVATMIKNLENYARSHGDPFLLVPYMCSHVPPEHKGTWPALPWVVRKVLVPYVFAWKYSGYWKYSPYAMS